MRALAATSIQACTSSGLVHRAIAAGDLLSNSGLNDCFAPGYADSPGRISPPDSLARSAPQSGGMGSAAVLEVGSTVGSVDGVAGGAAPSLVQPDSAAAVADRPAAAKNPRLFIVCVTWSPILQRRNGAARSGLPFAGGPPTNRQPYVPRRLVH